ncbi:hypothetical protein CHLNCDRAFT_133919 [Chlorella variabilis]|uniref:Disease resistance R13L4/SHOC-2-like LRR domain-containing protein n=1 Tax=Chlorella variabilis TaxID=554065 RepID=E1ZEK5_CHLVA|nr:hypothetical protein CHLNCDRAFT_133919 [Chlorella variabilis]EFN55678.1 hypothetical protein CHLNCDRAFT_133919 [Chlorella variabilis]|eukprot:XP_005847780.1 hypothetical protein CHLNCDRAFT_133919 [Chlorella variabilis]
MGLACSKKQRREEEEDGGAPIVRLSPFRPRRLLSRSRSLPPTLSQCLWEGLVGCGQLDDAAVLKLSGLGLHFFRLPLGAYPERVQPSWLRCLSTPSLEAADLSKTEASGMDEVLASLGPTPHLAQLCLDYCVDLTDGGLALLQGMTSLEELSLAGCELLTAVGMGHLRGLTRLRRLSLQTCHQISLAPLAQLRQLEQLDVGWCSSLDDSDAQVTDHGLACLHSLGQLRALNLAGVRVSDEALAALLRHLPHLRALNLERCLQAGDASLAAVSQRALQLRELHLGYTAVSDRGLLLLGGLTQLHVLSLENCSVGDGGLAVLSHLTQMRQLDLSDTSASNETMSTVAAMRQLECLNLSFTGVNDLGLKRLRRLSSLRCLNLDSRHFTDAGMVSVAQLAGLECLDLFGARIGDAGCASLSKLKNLRRLEVCGGGVTDAGVAHLVALTRLQHLSLAQASACWGSCTLPNYRVSNSCILHLIKLNELMALNLSQACACTTQNLHRCRVTSNSVVALGCLPKLQTLALYETRVKPFAVDKLLAANPDLCVQGVAPTGSA